MNDPTSPPLSRSIWLIPLLALLLLTLLLSTRKIGSHDLGFHLKGGEWIVQNHTVPHKDTFTYTLNHRDYLDSHWAYEVLLYGVQKVTGYTGLNLLNTATLVAVWGVLFLRLRSANPSAGLASLFLLGALLLAERRFSIRPEVFSWLFLSLTLLILDLRERGRNLLWMLPWLQLLWVNMEALFLLGWVVTATYAIEGRLEKKRWDPVLLKYGGLSMAICLLNPYFFKALLFPLQLFTRIGGKDLQKQSIVEFQSPWHFLRGHQQTHDFYLNLWLFFAASILALLVFLLTFKRRGFRGVFLPAAFAWLGFAMVRNVPLFGLVAFPILAEAWKDLPWIPTWKPLWSKVGAGALTLFLLLFCLRVATDAFYTGDRRSDRFGLGLDPTQLPVRAAEFLTTQGLNGRMLNHLGFGGWLDWKGPQPTFVDGRLEVPDEAFYEEYAKSSMGGGLAWLIGKYQPQLILTEYNAAYGWLLQLNDLPDWRLIYLDECTAIYSRKDYAPAFPALSFPGLLAERNIPTATDETSALLLERIQPSQAVAWFKGFYRKEDYSMGLLSMGIYALRTRDYPAARDLFAEGLRRAGGGYSEIYFNLGVSFLRMNNLSLGKLCLQDVIALEPDNAPSLKMLNGLKQLEELPLRALQQNQGAPEPTAQPVH